MNMRRWHKMWTIYRWCGMVIGIALLLVEIIDAMITPRPDWLWFCAGLVLIWLCRPRARVTDSPS